MARGNSSESGRVSLDELMRRDTAGDDKPARRVQKFPNGDLVSFVDLYTAELHNPDGPAVARYQDGTVVEEQWLTHGKLTRSDLKFPAFIKRSRFGEVEQFEYWKDGQRIVGPEGFKRIKVLQPTDKNGPTGPPCEFILWSAETLAENSAVVWDETGSLPNRLKLNDDGRIIEVKHFAPDGSYKYDQLVPTTVSYRSSLSDRARKNIPSVVTHNNKNGLHRAGAPAWIAFKSGGRLTQLIWAEDGNIFADLRVHDDGKVSSEQASVTPSIGDLNTKFRVQTPTFGEHVVDLREFDAGNYTPEALYGADWVEKVCRVLDKTEALSDR